MIVSLSENNDSNDNHMPISIVIYIQRNTGLQGRTCLHTHFKSCLGIRKRLKNEGQRIKIMLL